MIARFFEAIGGVSLVTVAMAVVVPAIAQDVYDTEILSRHADVERQRQLLRATVGRNGGRERTGPSANQKRICATKSSYRKQYGADEARVRKLYGFCAKAGL